MKKIKNWNDFKNRRTLIFQVGYWSHLSVTKI